MHWLEVVYYISNVVMTLTVVIAAISFIWNRKKAHKENERARALESLRILEVFQSEIIPKINSYEESLKNNIKKDGLKDVMLSKQEISEIRKKGELTFSDSMSAKRVVRDGLVKIDSGGNDVMNQLEHICAFIEHDLCDEEMLIDPIAKLVVDFKERNDTLLLLAKISPSGGEYTNLNNTYEKWKHRIGLDQRKQKIEKKREELKELESNEF